MSSAILLACALVGISTSAQIDNKPSDFVVVGEVAYGLMLPVQVVSSAYISRAHYSPSGDFVLAAKREIKITAEEFATLALGTSTKMPEGSYSLVVWNKNANKATEVWKASGPGMSFSDEPPRWFGNRDIAMVGLTQPIFQSGKPATYRRYIVEVSMATRTARTIAQWEHDQKFRSIQFTMDEEGGRYALVNEEARPPMVEIFNAGAGIFARYPVPADSMLFQFSDDGSLLHFVGKRPASVGPNDRVVRRDISMRVSDGAIVSVTDSATASVRYQSVRIDQPPLNSPIHLEPTVESVSSMMEPFWIATDQKSVQQKALVTNEAEYAELSPKLDGVLYITRGVAMVRPISKVPLAVFKKALEAEERTAALVIAKQVGLALVIYASKNDQFPPNSGDWMSLLDPYIRNNSLLDGFVYTFAGGPIGDIKDPSRTELGYVLCPGGRAVVYADSSARFVRNPPP